MSENIKTASENIQKEEFIEDEFGLGLKGYLLARLVFSGLCFLMVLGGLLCVFTNPAITFDVLISSSTGLTASAVDQNFSGYQMCMFAQAAYSLASPVLVFLFMTKRSKLFAYIDLAAFVVFFGLSLAMGAGSLLFSGSAWIFYLIFNPVYSFIALFVGKHFKYMPFK